MLKTASVSVFFLLLSASTSAHDIRAALFRLYADEGLYRVEIRLDKENIKTALSKGCLLEVSKLSDLEKSALLEDYLHTNFIVRLNGTEEQYTLHSFSYEEEFLVANAVFEDTKIAQDLSKIDVVNTCLLEIVEDHDNIILVHLNDRVRSFRLNKKLQSTTIKY